MNNESQPLFSLLGETADVIVNLLIETANNYGIVNKIVAFSGDNAPVNFGNVHRTGSKNVFKQLKEQVNANMIGAGCVAHVHHNAMHHACDQLPIDVEYIAVKIYTHFYRHTVRLRKLEEFCNLVGQTYSKLHGYSTTRFLALKQCLTSIIANFDGLNEYFHSFSAPVKIVEFFDDPLALVTLIFVRDQAENIEKTILQLEGDCICAIDAANKINELKTNIKARLQNQYFSQEFRDASEKIDKRHLREKRNFVDNAMEFHRTTLTYLNDWTAWLDDINVFRWIQLNTKVKWADVECAALWMVSRKYFSKDDMNELFNQYAIFSAHLNENFTTINSKKGTDKKWVIIFRHFVEKSLPFNRLLQIVEFCLVIPAANTTTERVFSHINDIWTKEKGKLKLENVRAQLMVKFNWKETCPEFYAKIKDDADFLQKVVGSEKYKMGADSLFGNQASGQSSTSMEID